MAIEIPPPIIRGKNALYPVTHKLAIRNKLADFHGEILECFNCFLPDHPFVTSSISPSPGVWYEGGVRYDSTYDRSHSFNIDITFAFTPLPTGTGFRRLCPIVGDFTNFPSWENITEWTQWTHAPGTTGHPSNWSAFIAHGPIAQWEANCRAAMSRGGSHGFSVAANMPNLIPPGPLDDTTNPMFIFVQYLRIFENLRLGNAPQWFSNNDAKRILTFSEDRNITPGGSVDTRIQVFSSWPGAPSPSHFQSGPDYWPFEFSAFRHDFWGLPSFSSPQVPFVFWIYDYSHTLGVTLQNLEKVVESGRIPIFPRGYIPHEDATGSQNGRWGYRWISNKWKYAPWERYPNL